MALSKEVEGMVALVRTFGLPHRVTDVNTPGVHTPTGYHYMDGTAGNGLAIDVAGLIPYWLNPIAARAQMVALCKALEPYEHRLAELICSHLPYSVKNGRRVARYAIGSHWDHVHLAVPRGTFLVYVTTPMEVHVVPDDPNIPNIEGPLSFHPLFNSEGVCTGYFIFGTHTGEVHGHGPGAKYYGRSEDITPG